jgi:hypothetical protein
MKAVIGLVLALALTLSVVPAVASDTFHALSRLPAVEQAGLAPLSDDQLAAVEGARRLILIVQVAVQNQINVCALCRDVAQGNVGAIVQRARVR